MNAYETVDAAFVGTHLGKMPLVDVRPSQMFDAAHIPGAVNIRYDVAAEKDDPAGALVKMFHDNDLYESDGIIVYCQEGGYAKMTCDALATKGFDQLYLYEAGMQEWLADGRPFETTSAAFAKAS